MKYLATLIILFSFTVLAAITLLIIGEAISPTAGFLAVIPTLASGCWCAGVLEDLEAR